MEIACPEQAGKVKVAFRKITGKGLWSNFRVPKGSRYSVQDVLGWMEDFGLNQIKMVPPGVITPWRFGCKIANFEGNILHAMKTLSVEARHFYHKRLFPFTE